MFGGQQEHGIRPGTIPVALVAGLGEACRIAEKEYLANKKVFVEIRTIIINKLEESGLVYELNGDQKYCIDSTINVSLIGISSEALMLSSKQYCGVSNGSACNSNSYDLSYVLESMNVEEEKIRSSIRISWGPGINAKHVIEEFVQLIEVAKSLVV